VVPPCLLSSKHIVVVQMSEGSPLCLDLLKGCVEVSRRAICLRRAYCSPCGALAVQRYTTLPALHLGSLRPPDDLADISFSDPTPIQDVVPLG
jgi:hypothetical protein